MHTALRQRSGELTRTQVAPITFADPWLSLCSIVERRALTIAEGVREMFVDNVLKPISLVHLNVGLWHHGAELALMVGPSPVVNVLPYPLPTVFVGSPAEVPQAVSAVFEHGIRLRCA
ncbi:hypothetical protein QF035_002682 [Streptomyces umbrinus]|uniref:Uncharacterized protein n=1 Tax=Streptomyces umbrinus TaxID=67370 RepID=A0ABU0SNI1_9ACTN|nr:hypothetical protein [Streptomyces umbrinus]MDQ1025100.1 hypothetical protein [Streptomyces umbrinus]